MIKKFNKFPTQKHYTGVCIGTQGICSSYGRKHLDTG